MKSQLLLFSLFSILLLSCKSEDSGSSSDPKLGGSNAFNTRTSIIMQSAARASAAVDSKINTDQDPILQQMIALLAPCTVEKKEATEGDPVSYQKLSGNCPVSYNQTFDLSNFSGSITYQVINSNYQSLNDVTSMYLNISGTIGGNSPNFNITLNMSGAATSQQYGSAALLSKVVIESSNSNFNENVQTKISYPDGGLTTGIVKRTGHYENNGTKVVESESCILNDVGVECSIYNKVINGSVSSHIMDSLNIK